tara:strand:+ start:286 stop:486 length:201 start_codon:yes stop_codon:yes gene_type:complete
MKVGDLIYLKPKHKGPDSGLFFGLLINKEQVGSGKTGSTILYDVLITEVNQILTLSDIYFDVWGLE